MYRKRTIGDDTPQTTSRTTMNPLLSLGLTVGGLIAGAMFIGGGFEKPKTERKTTKQGKKRRKNKTKASTPPKAKPRRKAKARKSIAKKVSGKINKLGRKSKSKRRR